MRGSNEKSLKEAIEEMLQTYHIKGRLKEVELYSNWPVIVGETLALGTKKIEVRGETLWLKVDSSIVKNEILYRRTEIIEKVSSILGNIALKNILFF